MKTERDMKKKQVQCYEILPKIGGGICPNCGQRTEYKEGKAWKCGNCKLVCDPDCVTYARNHKYVEIHGGEAI